MRVTAKGSYLPFLRNLSDIQSRRSDDMNKLSTGKAMQHLSDSPGDNFDIKTTTFRIDQGENYQDIMKEANMELLAVDDNLKNIADKFQSIRQLAIDSTAVGVSTSLPSLGFWVKGYLSDIVKELNSDFNGKFVFGGTKTTTESLNPNDPTKDNTPFLLKEGTATPENPSGISVSFQGNFEDRIINKDAKTQEVINTKANEFLGTDGVEYLNSAVDLYNILTYRNDGTLRDTYDGFSTEDISKINTIQQKLATIYENINTASGKNGTKINRLDSIAEQMMNEGARLKSFRSFKEDADMAEVGINLKKEENALNYTLQVGSQISRVSLFDFLS
jgi:flagellar hook-associated protein 3 FlgL